MGAPNRVKRWIRECHDPRFYALNFIMWLGLLGVGIAAAFDSGHWWKLIPWALLCAAGMGVSLLGIRSFLMEP
jgi:hypothetical protein